jgi:hypothetical protein
MAIVVSPENMQLMRELEGTICSILRVGTEVVDRGWLLRFVIGHENKFATAIFYYIFFPNFGGLCFSDQTIWPRNGTDMSPEAVVFILATLPRSDFRSDANSLPRRD